MVAYKHYVVAVGGGRWFSEWQRSVFAMLACVQHAGLLALIGWTKFPALLVNLPWIYSLAKNQEEKGKKNRREAAKSLIAVGDWEPGVASQQDALVPLH